ncbi:hypothetical protein [Macrococcus carouselicus]|nr:hypothetical protein [Macrococcus carouselicus]
MAKDKDQIQAEQKELAPEYDSHNSLDLRGTMISVWHMLLQVLGFQLLVR